MPLAVSIIIPVFDRHSSLEMSLGSVMQQDQFQDCEMEVLVVDDASPTPVQLHNSSSIQIIRHSKNKGAAAARNTGIAAAKGELVAFLDSDDVWLPNKLANQVSLYRKLSEHHDPDLLAVGSGFYDPGRRTGALRARMPRNSSSVELFSSGCWFCPGSAIVLSRKAFDIVGVQDENMRRLEDLDWFIRFGRAGGKYFCTDSYDVLIRPSGDAPFDAVITAAQQLADKYGPGGRMQLPAKAWNRLAAYLALERAVAYFGERQPIPGAIELAKTLLRKPRLRAALEDFWQEDSDIPDDIHQIFARMIEARD